jgi:hypothetical protein
MPIITSVPLKAFDELCKGEHHEERNLNCVSSVLYHYHHHHSINGCPPKKLLANPDPLTATAPSADALKNTKALPVPPTRNWEMPTSHCEKRVS